MVPLLYVYHHLANLIPNLIPNFIETDGVEGICTSEKKGFSEYKILDNKRLGACFIKSMSS